MKKSWKFKFVVCELVVGSDEQDIGYVCISKINRETQYKNWKITHWLLLFLKMKFIMQTFFTTTHPSIFNLLKIGSKKRGRLSKTRIRLVIVSSDKPISPCQSLLHSHCRSPKGQLISKCPFGVIVSTKIPTKKFDNFCPRNLKRGQIIR